MKSRLVLVFALLMVSAATFAQQAEVVVDTEGIVPSVKVTSSEFNLMCGGFARRLGVPADTKMINFKPKVMPPDRGQEAGYLWVVNSGDKRFEMAYYALPYIFTHVRGQVARKILRGTCYLENAYFYTRGDVVFVTASVDDALALGAALR